MNVFGYLFIAISFWTILCNKQLQSLANPLIGEGVRLAKPSEFPFVVSIGRLNHKSCKVNHFCTGSLVTKKHVLTAGHCIDGEIVTNIQVSIGTNKANDGQILQLKSMITHIEWANVKYSGLPIFSEDVGIMTLLEEISFPGATLAILSNVGGATYDNKDVIVAGWGLQKTESGDFATPYYLQTADVKVLPTEECLAYMKENFGKSILYASWICSTSTPRIVLTPGDSGGPLIYEKNIVIAVNSRTCPASKVIDDICLQNVHTDVHFVKDFIDDIIKNGFEIPVKDEKYE